jgi:hypothetical protein
MEVEDAGGADPVRLARAIHRQLPDDDGAVDVHKVAHALDILEIRADSLRNFEGALVTTPERDVGSILVNKYSNLQRQRYTLAHELLHFLNPLHKQTATHGFECRKSDMALTSNSTSGPTLHQRQEIEANVFAIELLAPRERMKTFLRRSADLEYVVDAAKALDLSRESMARRYVQLHRECLAIVFSAEGVVTYFDRSEDFPRLEVERGHEVPDLPIRSRSRGELFPMIEVDAEAWLSFPRRTTLYAQTLLQSRGHAMTLLLAERDD